LYLPFFSLFLNRRRAETTPMDTLVAAIDVAIPLHLDSTFHYLVPPELAAEMATGKRVLVPFGRRRLIGLVLGPVESAAELKPVIALLDPEPLLTSHELEFLRWASSYYLHPLGEVVRAALPAGLLAPPRPESQDESPRDQRLAIQREPFFRVSAGCEAHPRLGSRALEIFGALAATDELSRAELRTLFGEPGPQLKRLVELGLITREEREVYRDPFREEIVPRDEKLLLNSHQAAACAALSAALHRNSFAPFLLHGVTGSGKTEVYLQTIATAMESGKNALVLVPEIALTPQLVKRFRRRFPCPIAVLHSGLSNGERYDEWRRIRRGEVRIVIGARSAIFAPLADLGIIVVDEEHEPTYKQSEGFRYNARDLALVRGKRSGAVVLLGSATPLLTTIHGAREGKLQLLELPERVRGLPLPEIAVSDLRGRKGTTLSGPLLKALGQNLENGGQTLVFLNRRGFATYLVCGDCGYVFRCPNCSVTLTYHRKADRVACHYCDYSIPAPSACPECKGGAITHLGQGTERVEDELRERFPQARIARMDRDTTTGKGGHARVLKGLEEGTTDILVGTQMIAKGHDFPGVTLVGVLAIDSILNFPDFRSAERAYQLLTQVVGRAGRGDNPGRVVVQSLMPEHYAIARALAHDGAGFYREELIFREEAGYPPFAHLAALHFSGNREEPVKTGAGGAAALLNRLRRSRGGRVEILGPVPAPLAKVRGRYRWQILLKSRRRDTLHGLLKAFHTEWSSPAGIRTFIDVDPVELM
jgi:primosomal protein N' (replication factor Y) (superfamily II helicase)